MNDTLKVAGRIGAELGAAKAEVDRLREVLSRIANLPMYQCSTENDYRLSAAKAMAVAALSQRPEPANTYTATAAAQGFRDGQAAVEQAPAQDELDPIEKAALDARLRRDFEARWPVPKGVIWGAAVGDYCLSEFAQGIALSYPDMWMAYKAGSERGKA